MGFLVDPQEIFTFLGDPLEQYMKRFPPYINNAELRQYVEKYEQAGRLQKFFWAIDPIDHTRLEALAAKRLLEERAQDYKQRFRNLNLIK